MFTPNQIQQLIELIQAFQLDFLNQEVGVGDLLNSVDFKLLKKFGFNTESLQTDSILDYAFKFGVITTSLKEAELKKFTFNQLKNYIASGKFIPLTEYEKDVLSFVKKQSYRDIKSLGQRIATDLQTSISEVEKRKRFEQMVKKEVKKNIKDRDSIQSLISSLGKRSKDWTRDWKRVSHYVLHQAFDEGKAIGIEREYGKEALVYKDTKPSACPHCIRLYKTQDAFSKPKVFKLADLVENGSNIGRLTSEWKPVIGPTHPNCRCTLNKVPINYDWNPLTNLWDVFRPWERKVQRKSQVKITTGDREITI
jgi:hypothetical protein